MKHISVLVFLIFAVIVLSMLSSCNDSGTTQPPVSNNDDSCGGSHYIQQIHSSPFTQHGFPSTYTLGNQRYYNFYYLVDSICTDKHVKCSFGGSSFDTVGRIMKFTAAIEWQIFWEKRDTGITTPNGSFRVWRAEINDLGLKVPFGESAASVYVNVYVNFTTLGTPQQDSVFLVNRLNHVEMLFEFNYHKSRTNMSSNLINKDNYKDIAFIFDNKRPLPDALKSPDLYDKKGTFILRDYNLF